MPSSSTKMVILVVVVTTLNALPWFVMVGRSSTLLHAPGCHEGEGGAARKHGCSPPRIKPPSSGQPGTPTTVPFPKRTDPSVKSTQEPSEPAKDSGSIAIGDAGEMPLGSDKVSTGPELLAHYDPKRPNRACDHLPSNVTVTLEDEIKLGVKQELVGFNSSTSLMDKSGKKKDAYVMMVSNHKYIDGAIVMGDSLRTHSKKVKQGHIDVVIIVSDKIKAPTLQQLRYVFDRVLVMYSVGRFSPKSYYTTTFDKMYLFWLTWYEKVIFFDADTIAMGDPDFLFTKIPPKDKKPHYITAVGGSGYFQTALLILRPSKDLFMDVYLEYRFGTFGYNQWRARDGILLRTCFLPRHNNIGHPKELHHYYGDIKPWFNKDAKHKHAREKQVYDSFYKMWWDRYEDVHLRYFATMPLAKEDASPYGGRVVDREIRKRFGLSSTDPVTPQGYMWLQRYSKGSEYLRPTKAQYEIVRDKDLPGMKILVDGMPTSDVSTPKSGGSSCEDLCGANSLRCAEEAFFYTKVNSCAGINATIGGGCRSCSVGFVDPATPRVEWLPDQKTAACVSSFLHDPIPQCNASHVGRVCPCVPSN